MLEGLQLTFSINDTAYGINIENDNYSAYVGIKHNKKEIPKKKKLKPYRRSKKIKH